jgi:signal transduction histidine kinase
MIVASIERELTADSQRLAPLVKRIDDLTSTAVTSTRRIVNDLRPLMLEELGLLPALEALGQQFEERTGIAVRVAAQGDDAAWPRVSEQIEICLYRVAQESLTNVAKHSGATQVELQLTARCDGLLTMRIRDDGRGLQRDGRRSPLAFGLKGMTERVRALGGSLTVESGPGGGTLVTVEIGTRQAGTAA